MMYDGRIAKRRGWSRGGEGGNRKTNSTYKNFWLQVRLHGFEILEATLSMPAAE
jgi:hypothetical protein